ncbi:DNA repair protein RecO [Anaerobiospirillum sp. NML120449]|uniref:DNA repair protein RecO n=1 Tax=Anaerobiospirillum sp. NML120449 TaxID=2932817 RepID=UPI001FF2E40A|nr:DNA repair protein RecO [Anaerobiospirillum sp. NML120449]MCK0527305.1 DNA repair protein RecO [Anaerobiospirillum sp. NML120449]
MATIIENEPCYIFNSREYQESSLIVEAISPNYGAMTVIARGAANKNSPLKGVLQPFVPLNLTLVQGRGDMYFLRDYERSNEGFSYPMPLMFCAMYVNELLHHLYRSRDGDVKFFGTYIGTLEAISQRKAVESSLRRFEFELLAQLGYSLSLWDDQGRMLKTRETYRFCFGSGFVRYNEYLFEKAMNMGRNGSRSSSSFSSSPSSWNDDSSGYDGYDSHADDSDDGLMFSKSRVRGRRMESTPRNMSYGHAGHMGYENRAAAVNTEQDELLQKYYTCAGDFMGPVLTGDEIQDIISFAHKFPDSSKNAKALTSAIINRLLNGREVVSRRMYREYNQLRASKAAAKAAADAAAAAAQPVCVACAPQPQQTTAQAPAADSSAPAAALQPAAAPAAAEPAALTPASQPVPPAASASAAAPAPAPAADQVPPPAWSLALNAPGAADVPPPAWSLALHTPAQPQQQEPQAPAPAAALAPESEPAAAAQGSQIAERGPAANPVIQAAMNFASGQSNPYFEQGGEGARLMEDIVPSGGPRYVSQFASRAAQSDDDYEDIPEFEKGQAHSPQLNIDQGQEASAVTASQDSSLNLSDPAQAASQDNDKDNSQAPADSQTDSSAAQSSTTAILDMDASPAVVDLSADEPSSLQVTPVTGASSVQDEPLPEPAAAASDEAASESAELDEPKPESAAEAAAEDTESDEPQPEPAAEAAADSTYPDEPQPEPAAKAAADSTEQDEPHPDPAVEVTADSSEPDEPQPEPAAEVTADSTELDELQPEPAAEAAADSTEQDEPQPDPAAEASDEAASDSAAQDEPQLEPAADAAAHGTGQDGDLPEVPVKKVAGSRARRKTAQSSAAAGRSRKSSAGTGRRVAGGRGAGAGAEDRIAKSYGDVSGGDGFSAVDGVMDMLEDISTGGDMPGSMISGQDSFGDVFAGTLFEVEQYSADDSVSSSDSAAGADAGSASGSSARKARSAGGRTGRGAARRAGDR